MKVIFKTIVGKEIAKVVQPYMKVEDLKKLFEDDYVVNSVQFCFKGALLQNTMTLAESGVEDNGVIIITGNKHKNRKPESKTTETAQSSNTGGVVMESHAEANKSVEPSVSKESLSTSVTTSLQQRSDVVPFTTAEPAITTHGVDPSLIDGILAMGFQDRERVILALRAAQSNVERAVEFLCTGIPDTALLWLRESDNNANTNTEEGLLSFLDQPESQAQHGTNGSLLQQALMNIPQFEEIRAIVQSNPQSLTTVIQQLRIHHPEIIDLIQQNPNEFMELMVGEGQMRPAESGGVGTGGRSDVVEIVVGEEENAVIQRLVELGGGTWSEHDALQAYRACEGDEEAAAHFLLSNYFGDNS